MIPINDLKDYNARMEKGMLDKLWWIDMMPEHIMQVYDFGCADGALLSAVSRINPELCLSGYDNNKDMLDAAVKRRTKRCVYWGTPFTDFSVPTVLVASSVFHEIHSYSQDIKKDYSYIFDTNAEYIAIRDMFYSCEIEGEMAQPYEINAVRAREPKEKIQQFEGIWGPIESAKNMLHYLLKYRYETNWEREVRENYLPNSFQGFISRIPDRFDIVYRENYTLPYISETVKRDFGIPLLMKTHGKILLKKRYGPLV